jgi:UDP-N-acetylglucosamine acyltransferase
MNDIHPTAIITGEVDIGIGNTIGPHVVICGPCKIGDNNWIGPGVVIGTPGEYQGRPHATSWSEGSGGLVSIGSNNVLREYVTVHVSPNSETQIGNGCYVMSKTYIPHDAVLEDNAKLASMVILGGFVHIGESAYLGMGAIVHQRLVVGAGAMVGMGSVVTKSIPPLGKAYGNPARIVGANHAKFSHFEIDESSSPDVNQAIVTGNFELLAEISPTYSVALKSFHSKVG